MVKTEKNEEKYGKFSKKGEKWRKSPFFTKLVILRPCLCTRLNNVEPVCITCLKQRPLGGAPSRKKRSVTTARQMAKKRGKKTKIVLTDTLLPPRIKLEKFDKGKIFTSVTNQNFSQSIFW